MKDCRCTFRAALDPVPTFVTMHLDRTLLKPVKNMEGGVGTVQYRRVLDPSVFFTAWSYFDHSSFRWRLQLARMPLRI